YVCELAAGADHAAVGRLEELERIVWIDHNEVLVGMNSIGVDIIRRIHRHVRERYSGVSRENDSPAIGNAKRLTILIRAQQINHVRMPVRRKDIVVVPALSGAEIKRSISRISRIWTG